MRLTDCLMAVRANISSCLPPENLLTCAPPGFLTASKNSFPSIIVASGPRTGTHVLIDLILNNFPSYRRLPLYIDLDQLISTRRNCFPSKLMRGYVIKTHYPVNPVLKSSDMEAEIRQVLNCALTIKISRIYEHQAESFYRMWPEARSVDLNRHMNQFHSYWDTFADLNIDYEDLVCPDKREGIIDSIKGLLPPMKVAKSDQFLHKRNMFGILFTKLCTRLMGKYSPVINTGIRLG